MSGTSLARSVGQIDSFILMLRAACDDRAMNARLERLLSLPDERRRALVHTWIGDMVIAKAPRELIQAVACLVDDGVAEKAYEVIYGCRSSLAPAAKPRGRWIAPAVLTAAMLWGLVCGVQLAQAVLQDLRIGLPSPAGAAQLWRIAPGALGLVAGLGTATWLHARKPQRHWAWAAAVAGLAAALTGMLFMSVATSAPIVGCSYGEAALKADRLEDALGEFDTCLAFPNLQTTARADALVNRSAVQSRMGRYEQALVDQEASFRLRPPTTAWEHVRHAVRLRQAGRWEQSLAAALKAQDLELPAVRTTTRLHIAWALVELKRGEQAAQLLSSVIESLPEFSLGYFLRGRAYEDLNQSELAMKDFAKCTETLAASLSQPLVRQELAGIQAKLRILGLPVPSHR